MEMALRVLRGMAGLLLLAQASIAGAGLSIEIIGAGEHQIPITVVPFGGDASMGQSINEVVVGDLQRSGLFRLVDPAGKLPHELAEVSYPDWQVRGAEALAIGTVAAQANGRIEARFRLLDVVKQAELGGQVVSANDGQVRAIGHRIADMIYEKLTGDKGVFSTRIAYVNRQGQKFSLVVADSDGFNEQIVLASNSPIISPAWSPDGSHLAYVSFETGHAVVYAQSLYTNQRKVLADFSGSNSAPAWSPDGKQLAVVLTRDGSSQIYLVRPDGSGLRRITFSGAIDTEPFFLTARE
jgi:TolB protein